jgi:hypothetical protein
MMKNMIAILLVATSLYGAERTATVSGDWSAKDTWGQAAPGEGDTAVINDGVTVTVSDERVIGASGAKGAVAVNLSKTGAIVVAKGGTLRLRGDVVYTPASTQPAATVQGGGTWRWDASKAAAPKDTQYCLRATAELGYRQVVLEGKADARAVLDSDPAGGAGFFTRDGKTYGGAFKAQYADITRIGDAKTPGWDVRNVGGNTVTLWEAQHCTFTSCGLINVEGPNVFQHNYNTHVQTQGPAVFANLLVSGKAAKGDREILANVFDVKFAEWVFPSGFAIRLNYFGDGFNMHGGTEPYLVHDTNFYRLATYTDSRTGGEKFSDTVFFLDFDRDNPHVLAACTNTIKADVEGLIMSHAGTSNVDSGEWIMCEKSVRRCIILPNQYGYSSGEFTCMAIGPQDSKVIEHNTWFGGYGGQWKKYPGFAFFQYSEGQNRWPGEVKSMQSNIMWNPQLKGKEAAFSKMSDIGNLAADLVKGTPPVQDFGDPKNIDFNAGWGYTPDSSIDFDNISRYKNWGKGYIGNWSKTPGEHDVDADPQFLDYQRDVQLFATKCLNKTASRGQWAAKPDKPYAVGDTVINTTTILWGLPVMYRYIGSGENPEPGVGTREKGDTDKWRKSWEWASLYYIREGVRTGQKFGDDDVIMHLIKWIRAGYAPTNPALKGTAHDKGDIGAVPYQAKSDTQPASAPAVSSADHSTK